MKKKIMLLFLTLFVFLFGVACTVETDQNSQVQQGSAQQLQIFKTDLKLTQEQMLSQIKAQHLKENKGYLDSDEIVIMITLEDDSLVEIYNDKYQNKIDSIASFASSTSGKLKIKNIEAKQIALAEELKNKNLIISVENNFTTILNAITVKTTYGNLKAIEELDNVDYTILSETYNRPQATKDFSAVENVVDVYETGIFNSSTVSDQGITGNGTAVAVLDSGFDCSHSVFANQPSMQLIDQKSISGILSETNASKFTDGIELFDVYYSKKIPFMYDYADKDCDVFPYDSEHGTHVAGIIGGKDDVITGVAIDTQLVLMKVFPDLSDGGKTEDILSALEDAILLGVDAINMSLGSSCGFAREVDQVHINEVYDRLNESGISVLTAASNSYSSGFGGEQGNTNKVTNPDSGTVGSPSTYEACLSVASISGVKSRYIIGNDSQIFFFKESNSITGDENNFIEELAENGHLTKGETKTFDYVTVPGSGLKVNYTALGDISGKIALVRRGDNTFEEKAQLAKAAGAIACIIYNNIEGDITMSMGKSDHIPTISISKDDGTILASKDTGKLTISYDYQAGPFMSDFSSWGPTPSLGLKPEITAHGGTIKSSVPGGGYDELSGTSMATPNLCGIVVLIRQYLKEKYPDYTYKQISVLTNQLLMSTATIVLNEEGNPYSPRKQGAGLASLYNAVMSGAYLTVDGIDRPKLELLDDPMRTGVYEMEFNVVNISNKTLTYDLSVVGMTESVSTSDDEYVSERSNILNGNHKFSVLENGTLVEDKLTVEAGQTTKVKVVYTLTDEDKLMIDDSFPYGMYVEGFVKLKASEEKEIDLNIPFLAFYGDWLEAPMFDKTYYEVESEAHNAAIDEEDKLKADYVATTPYGSYFYNYIIPLGTYLYDVDTTKYDVIPASSDKIAISNILGTIDGLSVVYAGLLRCAKTMEFSIVDKTTGEVVWTHVDYNAHKAHSNGGAPTPYWENLDFKSYRYGLVNNREYEFRMEGTLDYGDGGINKNIRNSFNFDFTMDDEAPILKEVTYEKEYDKLKKKDRYYINMTVYDNHYAQSITPILFTSSSSYTLLSENPIPIYSEKGSDTKVRFEITDYLENIYADEIITSSLAFSIDDYALNSNIYLCQLPGTNGEFKFTKDGTMEGTEMLILSLDEGEVVDVTKYLASTDKNIDENKDYMKYLSWTSANEKIAKVKDGLVYGVSSGRTNITAYESLDGRQAILMINVREKKEAPSRNIRRTVTNDALNSKIESIRFSYFDTLFAYSRAAQTSEIGETGSRMFLSSMNGISFYPGEKIKLYYDFDPWYAEPNYTLTYKSMDPTIAKVEDDGTVTALKEGTTNIVLNVEGSNLMARVRVTVKSEFIIENRTLVAYKGLGGNVVIPDDEGILYIGAYAFCLYDTDNSIEVSEEDYDANKIPSMNTSIKSVVIPDGVEEIQKYAFYNCTGLESVEIPESVRFIREYAFYNDAKLTNINLNNIEVIGRSAFYNCEMLENVDLSKAYAIGVRAFEKCSSLKSVDLSALRNTGKEAFKDCISLESAVLTENTKLSYAMFVNSGLKSIEIYEKVQIPDFCFAKCLNLSSVTIHNDIVQIGYGAFSENPELKNVNLNGKIEKIGEQAFYGCSSLEKIVLPNNELILGNYSFYQCEKLSCVEFRENTKITNVLGSVFEETKITEFIIHKNNENYKANEIGLVSNDEKTIVFAYTGKEYTSFEIPSYVEIIGPGSFTGVKLKELVITNPSTVISDYAFANCDTLEVVNLPDNGKITIGMHAFNYTDKLTTVNNLDDVKSVGDYAFSHSGLINVVLGSDATFGEGAFFASKVTVVTIGKNSTFGLGAFQECANLTTVNMPEEGNVHFGSGCFAYDELLSTIDLSKVDSVIEDETFYGCKGLKSANLLTVKVIGEYAFSDCMILSYVNVPIVEEIKTGAFSRYSEYLGAPNFTSIELPNTLKTIGDGAFLGCEGLLSITIPSSVQNIGDYVFSYCLHLGEVVLPSTITRIGLYAFAGCSELISINLENVKEISDYAFTSCVMLENVNLENVGTIGFGGFASSGLKCDINAPKLTSVGDFGFQNTSFISFNAPLLEVIGEAAFEGNNSITKFVLSNSLSEIGLGAFDRCPNLESLYYISDSQLTNNGRINDYALLDNGILYTTLPNGHLQLSTIPGGLKSETVEILEDTYRIEAFAGSRNIHIKKLILPDSLKIIGNYAFYQLDSLECVEFKSIVAPKMEDSYDSNAVLEETDPGYSKLHQHFDMFGYELYYYNFIDLLGKKNPIKMILPSNEEIEGYDSIVYEVYFGSVANAKRSSYVAMERNLIDFIASADKIKDIKVVTLNNEKLINDAVRYLNSIKQNALDYGYTQEEWDEMVTNVTKAKKDLSALKLSYADKKVQALQNKIDALPESFNITMLDEMKSLASEISNLLVEDRKLLDLSKYNKIVEDYNQYKNELNTEVQGVSQTMNQSLIYASVAAVILSTSLLVFIIKRRVI